jgi:hypothetical protein
MGAGFWAAATSARKNASNVSKGFVSAGRDTTPTRSELEERNPTMAYTTKYKLHPRSVLSVLHEPLVDPRDGHGARSAHDIIMLRKWKAAMGGDDEALLDLVNYIVRENLSTLKSARKQRQVRTIGGTLKIRTLIPAAKVLGMITAEVVEVAPERDGRIEVTSRQAITFRQWFATHAFEREGVDPAAVEHAKAWLAKGGIQRPRRGEGHD